MSAQGEEGSIYFRLAVPSRSRMIYAERVPRLHAAGEFSLSALHPAVSPGWQSVALPSLSRSSQHRPQRYDASFLDDVQLPTFVPPFSLSFAPPLFFLSFFLLRSSSRARATARAHTRGCLFSREANHRATTNILSYARSK